MVVLLARCENLARQDADQISEINRLCRQINLLILHNDVGVISATTIWSDGDNNLLSIWRQPLDNATIQQTMFDYCCINHGSIVCRMEVIRMVGDYDLKIRTAKDYDQGLRVSEISDIACLPEVLYSYHRHDDMA